MGLNHTSPHHHRSNHHHHHLRQHCYQLSRHQCLAILKGRMGKRPLHLVFCHHQYRFLEHHMFRHHQDRLGSLYRQEGQCHTAIHRSRTNNRHHHRSLLSMVGQMLKCRTKSLGPHHRLYPWMQSGRLGSHRHCCRHHLRLGHHLANHKSCHHLNRLVRLKHHLGQSHRILQDRLPIHPGLYQTAMRHRYHHCHRQ